MYHTEWFTETSGKPRSMIRREVIAHKLLPYHCAICLIEPVWKEHPLSFILDHINGISDDHRLENLRWVCPNCNSQLPTFAGRNSRKHPTEYFCVECGKRVKTRSKTGMCISCNVRRRHANKSCRVA